MRAWADRPAEAANQAPAPTAVWRDAQGADADAISAIEHEVHTLTHERIGVFREKIALFRNGCRVLATGDRVVGYGIAHPWRCDDIPPLDQLLGAIPPDVTCLFLHDVAILPEARAAGRSRDFVDHLVRVAEREGLPCLALVSVYGTETFWRRHGFVPSPSAATSQQLAPYGETSRYLTRDLT